MIPSTSWESKMFFSEEKNQKTFIPGLHPSGRLNPATWSLRRIKSLLLLFFRKEELAYFAEGNNDQPG